jgi:hypothetical protein
MRILPFWLPVSIIVAGAAPLFAVAQQPPQLEPLEEGETPAITIRNEQGQQQIRETREGGQITEIQVKSGAGSYYVNARPQPGNVQRGEAQSHLTRPPQWRIKEFDLQPSGPAPADIAAPPTK